MYTGRLGGIRNRERGKSHPLLRSDRRRREVLHVALVELAARHAHEGANQRQHPAIPLDPIRAPRRAYSQDDGASYGATAPGVLGMSQATPGAYVSPRADGFADVPFGSPARGVSDMRAYDAYEEPPPPAPRRSRFATFGAWLLRLAILVHGMAALAHYAQESDLLMHGPPMPPPALKFLAPSAMPHDTPQKRRLLSLCVFQAMARVVAAYEGATNPAVAGIAALAYASDAAAFLTEAYVHPGPRMPPPETGRATT